MKVAVLMLSYERYDTLKRVLEHNMNNAGHPFDVFVWDNGSKDIRVHELLEEYADYINCNGVNAGIAYPLNRLTKLAYSEGYDAFHVMANDILEPDNWLVDKVSYLTSSIQTKERSGMISISPDPIPYKESYYCGKKVYIGDVIGQFMISREVYEKVGGFNEAFGYYGPIDNDYNARCRLSGFLNYYIPGQSEHLHDASGENYGYDKAALVAKTWPVHVANVERYRANPETCCIPVDGEHLINMKQYFE